MIRTLSTLSLLLASGIAVAAQADTAPTQEERPTMTVFGQLRSGGNGFNPVFTFQQLPQKRVATTREAGRKPAAACEQQADPPAPSYGGVQEI